MSTLYGFDHHGQRIALAGAQFELQLADGQRLSLRLGDDNALTVSAAAPLQLLPLPGNSLQIQPVAAPAARAALPAGQAKASKHKLDLDVQYAVAKADLPGKKDVRRWLQAALQRNASVTVRFVDAEEGQTLNRDYRHKDYATNVLTFTYDDEPVSGLPAGALPLLGDLVLCAPVVAREAAEQGKPLLAHYAHLIVHGALHLQGFDHEEEAEAEVMEALESQIVTALGYANPYAAEHG